MIYIIGAGGCGREVLNIYTDLSRDDEVAGFLEEHCKQKGNILNEKPVYDFSMLDSLNKKHIKLICAIGTPLRKRLIKYTRQLGYEYDTVIHPSAIKSKWIEFGEGVIICPGNILTTQIRIDNYTIINYGCTVGHDVRIGKYTTISPGVHISGRVSIGDECYIGAGAVVIDRKKIGNKVYIGAGAVVTEDIPDNVMAFGVPARPIRKLSETEWKRLI